MTEDQIRQIIREELRAALGSNPGGGAGWAGWPYPVYARPPHGGDSTCANPHCACRRHYAGGYGFGPLTT